MPFPDLVNDLLLKNRNRAQVREPANGVRLFADRTTGKPAFKDSAGTVSVLGGTTEDVVNVNTLADFPDPVAGVITLEAKKYLVNGEIDLGTNRIVAVSGSSLLGDTLAIDRLVRTGSPTGALLTVPAAIGNFEVSSLNLDGAAGGTVFDIQGAGTNFFASTLDVEGDIGTVNATVARFFDCSFTEFDDGITFAGSNVAVLISLCSMRQASGGTGTVIDITGTYSSTIKFLSTSFFTQSGGTAIKGLASNGNLGTGATGTVDSCEFGGTGTVRDTLTADDLQWVWRNSTGVDGSLTVGQYSMFSNATATTLTGSAWTKVLGTTTGNIERRLTHTDNRLTYNSLSDKLMRVDVEFNAIAATNNTPAEFGVSINGADPAEGSPLELSSVQGRGRAFFSVITLSSDAPADYVELWCRDSAGTSASITVSDLTVFVSAVATGT
jgi:hypothetical protein